MVAEIWQYLQFNFWLHMASLGAGLAVVVPVLLVPSWRRKLLQLDLDIETLGFVALVVLFVVVACYNSAGGSSRWAP